MGKKYTTDKIFMENGSLDINSFHDGSDLTVLSISSSGQTTFNNGQITLGGTGRIQGVDTVDADTDAANKAYVDAAVSGGGGGNFLPLTGGTLTGPLSGTSATFTGDINIGTTDNIIKQGDNDQLDIFADSGFEVTSGDGIKLTISDVVEFTGTSTIGFGSTNLATFDAFNLTAGRNYTLPNEAGTIALVGNIPTNNNQLTNGAGYTGDQTNISGNAATADLATTAVYTVINSGFTGTYPMLTVDESSGIIYKNTNVTYTGSTNTLTSPNFSGSLTGTINTATTGTTQAAGNNSTLIATTAYADAAAAAVDPSGVYLPLAGGTLTGPLAGTSATFSSNITSGSTTKTTSNVVRSLAADTVTAGFEAYGASQGTGYAYVGQSSSYGGGMFYNGDGTPAFAAGETADRVSFYRKTANVKTVVFEYAHNSSTVVFKGEIYAELGSIVLQGTGRIQGIDTVSAATDAANKAYVDAHGGGLGPFLKDTTDTFTGDLTVTGGNIKIGNNTGFVNSGSWTTFATPSGNIQFGPANTTWAHIYTDRPNFYFNKNLYVSSNLVYHAGNIPTWNQSTTGNATTASTAATSTLIKVNNYTGTTNMRILGSHQTGGSDAVYSASSMYLNCDTGIINATGFVGALSGNAGTATTFSTGRTNYKGVTDNAVIGQMMWKNYGNNHTIFDASASTSPTGVSKNNTNPDAPWSATYPTLMGYNGSSTYGVRVDSSRYADQLKTARTIAGVSFNGTANISLNNNAITNGASYLTTSGKAADANLLDGLNSTSFLRSDATDYQNNTIYQRGYLVNETGYRDRGVYGNYQSYKTNHIWSMGIAYKNSASGTNFGNLYGLAYKHTNNTTGGSMAGGHQMVWCSNGTGRSAMGDNIWTSGSATIGGTMEANVVKLTSGGTQYLNISSYSSNAFIYGYANGSTIQFGQPSSWVQNIRASGTATATNFILSSDKTLKNKIKEIDTNHIDVNWKNFELKSEPGVKRAGVIAQELEEKHPEFVRTDDEGMKSVAYIDLLITKIAELEARLEKLEK